MLPTFSAVTLVNYLICIISLHPASGDADYNSLDGTITFNADNIRMCFNVSIVDDSIYEDPENFSVVLATDDPSVDIDPDRRVGMALITDTDGKTCLQCVVKPLQSGPQYK
jgi:hypothetical protein